MFITAAEVKKERQEAKIAERKDMLEHDFLSMINTYDSFPEIHDKQIDLYLLETEVALLKKEMNEPYERFIGFTPSSANSCKRELYHKLKGDKRDREPQQPHQNRWKELGTLTGKMMQRKLLFIAKHYKQLTGEEPPFKPLFLNMNGLKVPAWEGFAQVQKVYNHNGLEIPIQGQPDGILIYKDGKRVGVEFKTKQTSYNKTSNYSLREAQQDHVKQVYAYSKLYGLDEYLIVYVNLAKKSWELNEEDQMKYQDIRAFYVNVDEERKIKLLDEFAEVVEAVKENKPPKIDVDKWAFNNFKRAIAESATDEEIKELEQEYEECLNIMKPTAFDKQHLQNLEAVLSYIKGVKGM